MDPNNKSGLHMMQAITAVHGDYVAGAISGIASDLASKRGESGYTCDDIRQAVGVVFSQKAGGRGDGQG